MISYQNTHGTAYKGIRTSEGVKGKKAVLKEDVSFYTATPMTEKTRKTFKAGTKVTCAYKMNITDLFIFNFAGGYQFTLRPSKFEWID
jgi:hypothetical protein